MRLKIFLPILLLNVFFLRAAMALPTREEQISQIRSNQEITTLLYMAYHNLLSETNQKRMYGTVRDLAEKSGIRVQSDFFMCLRFLAFDETKGIKTKEMWKVQDYLTAKTFLDELPEPTVNVSGYLAQKSLTTVANIGECSSPSTVMPLDLSKQNAFQETATIDSALAQKSPPSKQSSHKATSERSDAAYQSPSGRGGNRLELKVIPNFYGIRD